MIMITGATGFVGSKLLRATEELGIETRVLLRPSRFTPDLPTQRAHDVTLASLADRRGLRAAMIGVDTVIHLASAAASGHRGDLRLTDVQGTEFLAAAAADARVPRFIYLSHLGSSPASAYPMLRAKALAEEYIRASSPDHCILRSGVVFGEGDRLTSTLAMTLAALPFLYPIPGDGSTLLHPLWIDDLISVILLLLGSERFPMGTHEVGGPEHLTLRELVETVAETIGARRRLVGIHPAYLRGAVWLMERAMPRPPLTTHDIDYLASSRTASLDSMARLAQIQPSRFRDRIGYLGRRSWNWTLLRRQLGSAGVDGI